MNQEVDCLQLDSGQNDVPISFPAIQVNESMESMPYNYNNHVLDGAVGYNNVNGKPDELPPENFFGGSYQYTMMQQQVSGNATEGGTSTDNVVAFLSSPSVQNSTTIMFPSGFIYEMTRSLSRE